MESKQNLIKQEKIANFKVIIEKDDDNLAEKYLRQANWDESVYN